MILTILLALFGSKLARIFVDCPASINLNTRARLSFSQSFTIATSLSAGISFHSSAIASAPTFSSRINSGFGSDLGFDFGFGFGLGASLGFTATFGSLASRKASVRHRGLLPSFNGSNSRNLQKAHLCGTKNTAPD